MDAHTLAVHDGLVDMPLRVMSPAIWGSVLALARYVGVGTFPVSTFAACSTLQGDTWFRSSRVPLLQWPAVGSWRYLNLKTLRLAQGFWQLRRASKRLHESGDDALTLREFLAQEKFDPLFWRGLVLPLLVTICTCSEENLLAWPARQLLALLDTIVHGETLRRLEGGTSALVQGLSRGLTLCSGSPVTVLVQEGEKVRVQNARGESGLYDRAIIATQANHTNFVDAEQFSRERKILAAVHFDKGELLVHSDTRFMPKNRRDWAALSYMADADFSHTMFTVWVNAVEPTLKNVPKNAPPVLQTWNPLFEPEPELVTARIALGRAVTHGGTMSAQQALAELHAEPGRRVFFCGSWAAPGVPLLESAVRSAVAVAERLQWPVKFLPA
jgi:predicted NAD/FAD-binding protein